MPESYEEASKPHQGGTSYEDAYNLPPSLGTSAGRWATDAIRGLAKGTMGMAGMLGDVQGAMREGGEYLGDKMGLKHLPPDAEAKLRAGDAPTSAGIRKTVEKVTGPLGKPQDTVGRYVENVGEFAPAVAAGPASAIRKALTAIGGGIASEAAGEAAEGGVVPFTQIPLEPIARAAGGAGGMMVPGMARKAITPFPISAERQGMVDTLRKEGVEPTAGDVTGSKTLKYAEHALGDAPGAGGKYHDAREKVRDSFTKAALARIGETAERATPEVMDRAVTRIGNQFDTLAARNSAQLDPQFAQGIMKAVNDYDHLFVDPLKKPMVEKVANNIVNLIQQKGGALDGEVYKTQRSMIDRMRRNSRNDPELSGFLMDVRQSLDDVMERSIIKNNPADAGAWKEVRNQYRNLLALERVTAGAGEAAAEGTISPARLRQSVVSQGGKRSYSRGSGDFADLARSGEAILKEPPTSGTTERSFLHGVPAAMGGVLGSALGGTAEAIPGVVAGAMAPGMTGRAVMSRPMQKYLKNQLLAKGQPQSVVDALVRSAVAENAR